MADQKAIRATDTKEVGPGNPADETSPPPESYFIAGNNKRGYRAEEELNGMVNYSPVLLIEDNSRDVELLRRAFKQARMANPIKVLANGVEAIDYLSGAGVYADRNKYPLPFLVLLDLNLAEPSGLEVLRWIRKQPALGQVRVVILTSREACDTERAFALGADSYLNKPGNFEQLVMLMNGLEFRWAVIE